jgi:hypothetical protein
MRILGIAELTVDQGRGPGNDEQYSDYRGGVHAFSLGCLPVAAATS